MKKIYGIMYALLSSAAFGFMPIFAKEMYNNGINTLTVISLRFLLAALLLLIYFLFAKVNFRVSKSQLVILLLVGMLGYTSTGLTLFFSYNYISVGLATTMHFIYPAVVIILNYLIYKETFTRFKLLALLLSTTGVYILIGIKTQGLHLGGALLALASGFTYAGCVMGMNHKEVKKLCFSINPYTLLSITGISLVSTIISIGLFVKALKAIGSSSTSILGTFEPIVSIIMGIILFNEKITLTLIIGTMLILFSVVILAKEKQTNGE